MLVTAVRHTIKIPEPGYGPTRQAVSAAIRLRFLFKYNGKKYIAIFTGKTYVVVEAANGKKVASINWPNKYDINAADPVVTEDGQNIFITSGYKNRTLCGP